MWFLLVDLNDSTSAVFSMKNIYFEESLLY